MASELHGRQDKIIRGPMFSGCDAKDVGNPLKAKTNLACVSSRSVNKRIAKNTSVNAEPKVQVFQSVLL